MQKQLNKALPGIKERQQCLTSTFPLAKEKCEKESSKKLPFLCFRIIIGQKDSSQHNVYTMSMCMSQLPQLFPIHCGTPLFPLAGMQGPLHCTTRRRK